MFNQDEFHGMLDPKAFHPFEISLNHGETIRVNRPEAVKLGSRHEVFEVEDEKGAARQIDVSTIRSIRVISA